MTAEKKYYEDEPPVDIVESMFLIMGCRTWVTSWAQILDWFMNKGIVIRLSPGFTYALQSHIGFTYKIYTVKTEAATLEVHSGKDFASFGLTIYDAVGHAIKLYKEREHEA